MKVFIPTKNQKKVRIIQAPVYNLEEAVENFTGAMSNLDEVLVDRDEEVEAIKMGIVCSYHVILEGTHGTAKSMLTDQIFRRIEGASIFDIQFMKGTNVDEIFGAMDSRLYKEEAIWKFNTKGMFPDCHFAFLDEVYRASDAILPSTMRIMNERKFKNGLDVVDCPLITAVGTTNFVTDTEELAAYHDRWHIQVKVNPIESPTSLMKMISLANEFEGQFPMPDKLASFEDVKILHKGLRRIEIDMDILTLYRNFVVALRKTIPQNYLSDRRICQALRAAKARALLEGRTTVEPEHLEATKYLLIKVNETNTAQAFMSLFQSIVGTFTSTRKERKAISILERYVRILEDDYDDDMPKELAIRMYQKVKEALSSIRSQTPDQRPTLTENLERQNEVVRKLESLAASLRPKVVVTV